MGSVKVMGRDSGPKGAYAHQYLDRRTQNQDPKAEGDFVFKIALDPLARCEEGKPAGAPGRSSDSSLAALWVKCKKTLTGDSRAFRWHSQIRV